MRPLLSVAELKQLDGATRRDRGMSSLQLMSEVAKALSHNLLERFSSAEIFQIFSGPGDNGSDGYLLAEALRLAGRKVYVTSVRPPHSSDCQQASKLCKAERALDVVAGASVLIDSIYGLSGRAELDTSLVSLLKKLNRSKGQRVAIDISTGVDLEREAVHAEAFRADLTLTIAYPKLAFLNGAVAEVLGELEVINPGFTSPQATSRYRWLEREDFIFRKRIRTSYKSNFGKCGVVAGGGSTPGAAYLVSEAAHRVGAGYVHLYWANPKQKVRVDLRTASFLQSKSWTKKSLMKETALVVGPGGAPLISSLPLREFEGPWVLDADALDYFERPRKILGPAILTPHPGEAARMLQVSTREVAAGPAGALQRLVEKSTKAVYLKGAPGRLQFPESSECYVNLSINPVFAKAGSGDVLSGMLGGFLAMNPAQFRESIFSALVFQREVGEVLRGSRASLATDQLGVFSEAFRRLGAR